MHAIICLVLALRMASAFESDAESRRNPRSHGYSVHSPGFTDPLEPESSHGSTRVPPSLAKRSFPPTHEPDGAPPQTARERQRARTRQLCRLGTAVAGCVALAAGGLAAFDRYYVPRWVPRAHARMAPYLAYHVDEAEELQRILRETHANRGRPPPLFENGVLGDFMEAHTANAARVRRTRARLARWARGWGGGAAKGRREAVAAYDRELARAVAADEELGRVLREISTPTGKGAFARSLDELKRRAGERQWQVKSWNGGQSGIPEPGNSARTHEKEDVKSEEHKGKNKQARA